MSDNKVLTCDEKLVVATKIIGQMELAGAREKDAYDILAIAAQLFFSGRLVKLTVSDMADYFNPKKVCETLVTIT